MLTNFIAIYKRLLENINYQHHRLSRVNSIPQQNTRPPVSI